MRLLARERVAMHRSIAAALEQRHSGSLQEAEDALAYHTFEAGDWDAARRHAMAAATHALTLGAAREALQHFERAVTATERIGSRPDAPLLVARGRAHETLGAFTRAHDDFVAALDAARARGDRREEWVALHALGMLWAARDYERSARYRRDALDVARFTHDEILIARSLYRVGNWHANRDDPRSGMPYHNEALAMFERADDRRGVAESVDLLAMASQVAGEQEAAVRLYERSVTLFTALNDRRSLANALSVLLVCGPSHHASAGPVCASPRTEDLLASERAVRLATEVDWRAGEAFSRYLLADCLAWRGDFERALALARESLAIAEEMEHLEWQCGAHRVLGVIAHDLHALLEARTHLESAYRFALRLGSATWMRWTAAPFVTALANAGLTERAGAVLDEVEQKVNGSTTEANRPGGASRTLGERSLLLARAELAIAARMPVDALAVLDA